GRRAIVLLFEAIADALLVIIAWVLWVAPLGVLALAYTVGSAAGGSAFAGLGHYVVLISVIGIVVTLACYPLVMIAGRIGPCEVCLISSILPIALALGVPIAPLALLVAVEMIPDIFRTVGNVWHDVAVTTVVDRSTRNGPQS